MEEQIGAQSALMWGQASMLTEQDIETIGKFIEYRNLWHR